MQKKTFFSIFFISLILVGCNNDKKANGVKTSDTSEYISDVTYTYFRDGSCTSSDKNICLTEHEYKEICKISKGISKGAIRTRTVLSYGKEKALADAGNFSDIVVFWDVSRSGIEQCYASLDASGIYEGTSSKIEIWGIAQQFIKDSKGDILVHYFSIR